MYNDISVGINKHRVSVVGKLHTACEIYQHIKLEITTEYSHELTVCIAQSYYQFAFAFGINRTNILFT